MDTDAIMRYVLIAIASTAVLIIFLILFFIVVTTSEFIAL